MKKQTWLAVLAFGVLLAVVLATREGEVNEGVPHFSLPALGEVTAVEISGAHAAKLQLANGAWTASGHPADAAQVKSLVDALQALKAGDFVTQKPEKHAELEVDDAKGTRVQVAAAAGPGWAVVFGKPAKSGGAYVRVQGQDAVFITQSSAAHLVRREPSAWRSKAIATAPLADIAKVTVAKGGGSLSLVAAADGGFALDPAPPPGFRFDGAAASRLVGQLASLTALGFSDGGVAAPEVAVKAELRSGKAVSLTLGARQPDGAVPLAVEGDPQTYLVPGWTADALARSLEDLRDTTLLSFEPEKVSRVRIAAGGQTTELAKEGGGWKVVQPKAPPSGFELDPQAVTQVLQRYRGLRAVRAVAGVSDKAAGLAKPSALLELDLEGGGKQALRFGGELPSKELYVKGSADGLVYAIGAPEKASLERGLELFKKHPPPDPSQVRGLEQLPPELRQQLEAQLRARQQGE